jgi:predicted DNA-binding transcriptional regulator AlpA
MSKRRTADSRAEVPAVSDCERLWTTDDVSAFLGVPIYTLWHWSHMGTGPRVFKVGRHLRYDPDDVRRWLVEECQREASA